MGGGGKEEGVSLEVAAVFIVIFAVPLAAARFLRITGKYLKRTNQKPLYEALQKVEQELMRLGFIYPLYCMVIHFGHPIIRTHLLPYSLPGSNREDESESTPGGRCAAMDKVPLQSLLDFHHLPIFFFVIAIAHIAFSVLTIVFGGAKIRQWKSWEDAIAKYNHDVGHASKPQVTHVQQHELIKKQFSGMDKRSAIVGWLLSFFKQFYGSVTESDYAALRFGFIMTHCRENPKFNFHRYMIRALEADFKKVLGISWYLLVYVILFLLLNNDGWHTYFWITFIPFILLIAVGTKLEHVISQLAYEVAEKQVDIEGELVVKPSDDHFWFHRPHIVLYLIHFIIFKNAFEIAFFLWISVQYDFDSCIMGKFEYIIPRLVIGVFSQVLCSYSALPLYVLVTQMGTHFKKSIFDKHMQEAKRNKRKKVAFGSSTQGGSSAGGSSSGIPLVRKESKPQAVAKA